MKYSPLLDELIKSLQYLPSIGSRSAQRIAFHLLERNREKGLLLSEALTKAMQSITHCKKCRMFTEYEICHICSDEQRASFQQLCIVETPSDLLAIENSSQFNGYYFVLMGNLSPLEGIGPEEIGLPQLMHRFENEVWQEIILATNSTVEGEVTAEYIQSMAKKFDLAISRIAHGIPIGGELEYIDGATIAHSFSGRKKIFSRSAVE